MVWTREGLQRVGDGPTRTESRGSLQLLLAKIHDENRTDGRRPDDCPSRVRTLEKLHPQGHQTGQFPHGHRGPLQQTVSHRLRTCQEVS